MKTSTRLTAIVVLGVALSSLAAYGVEESRSAGQIKSSKASKRASNQATKVEKIYVTGSRIPREVKRANYPSGTELTLTMIDRKQIDRLGAADVTEVMQKVPMFR